MLRESPWECCPPRAQTARFNDIAGPVRSRLKTGCMIPFGGPAILKTEKLEPVALAFAHHGKALCRRLTENNSRKNNVGTFVQIQQVSEHTTSASFSATDAQGFIDQAAFLYSHIALVQAAF